MLLCACVGQVGQQVAQGLMWIAQSGQYAVCVQTDPQTTSRSACTQYNLAVAHAISAAADCHLRIKGWLCQDCDRSTAECLVLFVLANLRRDWHMTAKNPGAFLMGLLQHRWAYIEHAII